MELPVILKALQECRTAQRYYGIIKGIYENATTTVHLRSTSIRQGDTMSPKLFITVFEHAFKRLLWEQKNLNHLRFADDTDLLPDNLEKK